jgi:hypothetical protein
LAAGQEVAVAARAAGMSERTAYRRLAEPGFRRRVSELRRQMLERAVAFLQRATAAAVGALLRNLTAPKAGDQIRAAQLILDNSFRGLELMDVLERGQQLEERLGEKGVRDTGHPRSDRAAGAHHRGGRAAGGRRGV